MCVYGYSPLLLIYRLLSSPVSFYPSYPSTYLENSCYLSAPPTVSSSPRLLQASVYSLISLSLRDLFLFISFPIMSAELPFALLDARLYLGSFSSPPLSLCLANLLLTSSYHLVLVVFISLPVSIFHICSSHVSMFQASNLFMFSLVLQ